jgi:hypothetical protein
MLKKILSISGRPGLFKLISYGKNLVIVEGLSDGKRIPAHSRDKIISLGDIAIYTSGDEVPLSKVLENVFNKYEGKQIDAQVSKTPDSLKKFFLEILPDYDQERVHNSDIKKLINWYNLLIAAGYTSFKDEEKEEGEAKEGEEATEADKKDEAADAK